MHGNRGFLMMLPAVGLIAASGMALPRMAAQASDQAAAAELLAPAADTEQAAWCGDESASASAESAPAAPPGCCSRCVY